ncbi:IS200/IS605 family transposase [Verrucomicrobia bacterium LW23]|nr:IS200/IS605 family transposase [Verrucomicrobia bacterium LW23]
MSQSLSNVLIHAIFSTKERAPWLVSEIRDDLWHYLTAILNNIDCPSIKLGGIDDHVHVLFSLSRTMTVADVIKTLKANSSKWIKTKKSELKNFQWQQGYAAFSVSPSSLPQVITYIHNQEKHHKMRTFMEEYISFLDKHGIKYDPKYVWD